MADFRLEIAIMQHLDFAEAKVFIYKDIEREIRLAYASERDDFKVAVQPFRIPPGGANFLAAMGLLSYTDFAGKLKYKSRYAKTNFNCFFDDLGPEYKQFRGSCPRVYDIFRCGLVHEYYTKDGCDIHMVKKPDKPFGIGEEPSGSGRYYFVVETYFEDFKRVFDQLEKDLYNVST
jgi:hypothetical protein